MWKESYTLIDKEWICSFIVRITHFSGKGQYGQLGLGNSNQNLEPELILYLTNFWVTKVACTDYSSFAFGKAKDFNLLL